MWRGCLLSLWRELCPRHGRHGCGPSGNFLVHERHELLHRKRESPSGSLRLRGSLRLWCGGLLQWWGGGGGRGFAGPGLFFVIPIIIAAVCCAVMCVEASGIAASVVRRITDQVAGKRPLRLIQVVST